MRRVQVLFGNHYPTHPRLWGTGEVAAALAGESHVHRLRRRAGRLAPLVAILIPAVLLSASLLATADNPPGSMNPEPVFSQYNSGQLSIVFPSALPSVELFQDANSSIGAALYLDHVLELQPGNSDHPIVVQVASLTTSPFHQTSATSGQDSFGLQLNGSVSVDRVNVPLWKSPSALQNISTPFSTVVGGASLRVSYSLLRPSATSEGVALSWSIVRWPWLSNHDLLGIETRFVVFNATRFSACTGTPALNDSPGEGCNGTVLAPGGILWNASDVGSVAGSTATGLKAAFSWGNQANATDREPTPVTVGTYYVNDSTTRMTIASPATGSGNVTASGSLIVSTPIPPLLSPVLVGDGPAYASAAVLFTAAAIGAVVWFRHSERKARSEL